ncbi:MAG: DNA recombination protein RmuC [Deltaproteobacteria bacterium]|nr:DNA recombination protein RmuC [Deltaproteobacteria bacterium]
MNPMVICVLAGFAGLVVGGLLVALAQLGRTATAQAELAKLTERALLFERELKRREGLQLADAADREALRRDLAAAREALATANERASLVPVLQRDLELAEAELSALTATNAELSSRMEEQQRSSEEKLQLLQDAEANLGERFKNLANEILEQKTQRFTDLNQERLGDLLNPLKEQLTAFKARVDAVHEKDIEDRSALKQQVEALKSMNDRLSNEASNLVDALRGSTKTQGNWGELVLERILEAAALRKGHEFDVQENHTLDDGKRAIPDVTLHMPGERHLVIDSKVSLLAYQEATTATDDEARAAAIRRHVDSVRTHVRGLAAKNYQELYRLKSIDFVVMFVPIEPAYMLAIEYAPELWQDAWSRNVLLVSPSTLLFVLRTVAHLWRQESQQRNALDIARRGAELYDKLVGFVEDLEKVGKALGSAQEAFAGAKRKLHEGKGNVIRQAEMLKELGVKPTKSLPSAVVEQAMLDAADNPNANDDAAEPSLKVAG